MNTDQKAKISSEKLFFGPNSNLFSIVIRTGGHKSETTQLYQNGFMIKFMYSEKASKIWRNIPTFSSLPFTAAATSSKTGYANGTISFSRWQILHIAQVTQYRGL